MEYNRELLEYFFLERNQKVNLFTEGHSYKGCIFNAPKLGIKVYKTGYTIEPYNIMVYVDKELVASYWCESFSVEDL